MTAVDQVVEENRRKREENPEAYYQEMKQGMEEYAARKSIDEARVQWALKEMRKRLKLEIEEN